MVWVGTWQAIKITKGLLRDYLWDGQQGHVQARVAWTDYCAKTQEWGS